MKITDVAIPARWDVTDAFTIAGWEFGAPVEDAAKPVALLHHANGMCAATWAPVAVQLAQRYHVFAVDARGHGDSTHGAVPDDYPWMRFVTDLIAVAEQILAATGHSRIALGIGSSFGGIITAAAQAEHGALFERIVMLDPPIHPTEALAARLGLQIQAQTPGERSQLVTQTLKRRAVWPSRAAARSAWRDKPLFAAWQPAAFDLYIDEGLGERPDGQVELKCPPSVEAHIFETTGSLAVEDYAPGVAAPVHLVHAEQGYFPAEFFRAVAGLFPDGEFLQLPGGHLLPLEIPEQVAEYLLALNA